MRSSVLASASHRSVQKVTQRSSQDKGEATVAQLRALLGVLNAAIPPIPPLEYRALLREQSPQQLGTYAKLASDAIHDLCGFSLALGPSRLAGGGLGVFVEKGCVREGQLVALYPGQAAACVGEGMHVCVCVCVCMFVYVNVCMCMWGLVFSCVL